MLKRRSIFLALAATLSFTPISAQEASPVVAGPMACGVIETLGHTLAVTQEMQLDAGENSFADNIGLLEALSSQISLSALIPQTNKQSFSLETETLIQYQSQLGEIVTSAGLGYENIARQNLDNIRRAPILGHLKSFEVYWSCTDETINPQGEAENKTDRSDSFDTPKSQGKSADVKDPANSGQPPTDRSTRATNNQVLGDPNFYRGGELVGNPFAIIAMGVLGLFALLFFAFKRKRKFEKREERRFTRLPVTVRIEDKEHDMLLVDISMSGMKLQHLGVVSPKDKVRINLGGSWYIGHAQWSNDTFAGIRFQRPLKDEVLDAIASAQ